MSRPSLSLVATRPPIVTIPRRTVAAIARPHGWATSRRRRPSACGSAVSDERCERGSPTRRNVRGSGRSSTNSTTDATTFTRRGRSERFRSSYCRID